MKVEQLLYTSCEQGLSANPGFMVQAISTGLDRSDKRELESSNPYVPPSDLPLQPTLEQIRELCPPMLFCRLLASGKIAVTRTIYIGFDYSGRPGNYLAHTLIFASVPDFHLGELFDWSGWHNHVQTSPPTLESLDESHFQFKVPASKKVRELILNYPYGVDAGKKLLAVLVDAALVDRDKDSAKGVILRAPAPELNYWVIAVAMAAVPSNASKPLTFCSYITGLTPSADVRGTLPETAGGLVTQSRPIVDVTVKQASNAPEYARYLVESFLNANEDFNNLNAFADDFELTPAASEWKYILDWLEIEKERLIPANTAALIALANFICAKIKPNSKTAPRVLESAINKLRSHSPQAQPSSNSNTNQLLGDPDVCQALAVMANHVSNFKLIESVRATVYRSSWNSVATGGNWRDFASALESLIPNQPAEKSNLIWNSLATAGINEFVKSVLETNTGLQHALGQSPAVASLDYLEHIIAISGKKPWETEDFVLLAYQIFQDVPSVRNSVAHSILQSKGSSALAMVCAEVRKRPEKHPGNLPAVLAAMFSDNPSSAKAVETRTELDKFGHHDLVDAEVATHIDGARNFQLPEVLLASRRGGSKSRSALTNLWAKVPANDRNNAARELVSKTDFLDQFDQQTAVTILQTADATLRLKEFSSPQDHDLREWLSKSKYAPLAYLRNLNSLQTIDEAETIDDDKSLELWCDKVAEYTDPKQIPRIAEPVISRLLDNCGAKDMPTFSGLCHCCLKIGLIKEFARMLDHLLATKVTAEFSKETAIQLTRAWLLAKQSPQTWPREIHVLLCSRFPKYLSLLPKPTWEGLKNSVAIIKKSDPKDKRDCWKRTTDEVDKTRKSVTRLFGSAFSYAGRMFTRFVKKSDK